MIDIPTKIKELKQNYYHNMMIQMQHESYRAASEGDQGRSVILYHRYLCYKHKYIKAGGKL